MLLLPPNIIATMHTDAIYDKQLTVLIIIIDRFAHRTDTHVTL